MYDFEIAFYLYKMAKIQSVFCDSHYKAKAYYSAAMAIDACDNYVEKMAEEQRLREIPYIGKKIESTIYEIIQTGKFIELNNYEMQYGIDNYSLLLGYGLSDALLRKLWQLSIKNAYVLLDEDVMCSLQKSLTKGEYTKVETFMHNFDKCKDLYLAAYGRCLAEEIVELLKEIKGVLEVRIAGGIAENCEKITHIEIEFSYIGDWKRLIEKLEKFSKIKNIHDQEFNIITGITAYGIPFELKYCQNITNNHIITSYKVIKGDLHTHTLWSDGIHSIEDMANEAERRGYEYLAVTDHSASMRIAHGLSENQALNQIKEIRQYNKKSKIKILAGIEVDILADGSLDYSNEVLSQFDFVIAAIHNNLNQTENELIQRLEHALANPYINILAHPTGRLLGRPGVMFCERNACKIEIQKIIELCKKNNVVLEVNCFPERLDLNENNIIEAINCGVKISLGTDSHSLAHLCNIDHGLRVIEKLKIDYNMVINTYSYNELLTFFKRKNKKINCINKENEIYCMKDFNYYFHNNLDIINGNLKIIGIDLTGSEKKESGWAYMQADSVKCRRIKTDNEIIESVMQLKPNVISIDSPLAYPRGRCCSKKTCKCSKYGIMRNSERLLRHFGITVYPCLIDSMINLTTRGMKLSHKLREMGYNVIESYPGVAQDILEIPRKGKTVEQFQHLKKGLESFGIKGDLVDNPFISHDEVDAITSALVGYFYINKQYVGLGNEDEDYLIVPRIQDELLKQKVVIGLCGETGAGKTTIAEYLRFKYGLKYFRYSEVIKEQYHVSSKIDLQDIGNKISKDSEEQRKLTRYIINNMEDEKSYVIDGLRHLEDYDELKNKFGKKFILINVDCRYNRRYNRYNKLYFNEISPEKFEKINNHVAEKDIVLLKMQADYEIDNNNGYKYLREQVDDIIMQETGGKR